MRKVTENRDCYFCELTATSTIFIQKKLEEQYLYYTCITLDGKVALNKTTRHSHVDHKRDN